MVLGTTVLVVVWFEYSLEEPDTLLGLKPLDVASLHVNNVEDNLIRQQ